MNTADVLPTLNGKKELLYSGFRLHENGLTPIGVPSLQEWRECGRFLRHAQASVHFWIGDWLNFGEQAFGTPYEKVIGETGFDYQTVASAKWVAAKIALSRRRETISFEIHKEAAVLLPDEQEVFLTRAGQEGWTVQQARIEKHRLLYEKRRERQPASPASGSQLLPGDPLTVLLSQPENSVDLLLTDPAQSSFAALPAVLAECIRVLKDHSHMYLFTPWEDYPALRAAIEASVEIKNLLVWEHIALPPADTANYAPRHTFIVFAHKERRHLFGSRDKSVFSFAPVPAPVRLHDKQKPLEMLSYLIEKSTKEGETVLDPFMNVGDVPVAAKQCKRHYLGIESDPALFHLARSRLT
jgi:hypothetical protein